MWVDISSYEKYRKEIRGTSEKYWIQIKDKKTGKPRTALYKVTKVDPITGYSNNTNYGEYIYSKICNEILGVPCAKIELATNGKTNGCISYNVLEDVKSENVKEKNRSQKAEVDIDVENSEENAEQNEIRKVKDDKAEGDNDAENSEKNAEQNDIRKVKADKVEEDDGRYILIDIASLIQKIRPTFDKDNLKVKGTDEYYSIDLIIEAIQEQCKKLDGNFDQKTYDKLKKYIINLCLVDSVLGCEDRHSLNLSVGQDKKTSKLIPIELYDNGSCLGLWNRKKDVKEIIGSEENVSRLRKSIKSKIGTRTYTPISFDILEEEIFNHYFDEAKELSKVIINRLTPGRVFEILNDPDLDGLDPIYKKMIINEIEYNRFRLNTRYEKGKNKNVIENLLNFDNNIVDDKVIQMSLNEVFESNNFHLTGPILNSDDMAVIKELPKLPDFLLDGRIAITYDTIDNIKWAIICNKLPYVMQDEGSKFSASCKKNKIYDFLANQLNFMPEDIEKIKLLAETYDLRNLDEEKVRVIINGSGEFKGIGRDMIDEFLALQYAEAIIKNRENANRDDKTNAENKNNTDQPAKIDMSDACKSITKENADSDIAKGYKFNVGQYAMAEHEVIAGQDAMKEYKNIEKYVKDIFEKNDILSNLFDESKTNQTKLFKNIGISNLDDIKDILYSLAGKIKTEGIVFDSVDEIEKIIISIAKNKFKSSKTFINGLFIDNNEKEKIVNETHILKNGEKLVISYNPGENFAKNCMALGADYMVRIGSPTKVENDSNGYNITFFSRDKEVFPENVLKEFAKIKESIEKMFGQKNIIIKQINFRGDSSKGQVFSIGSGRTSNFTIKKPKNILEREILDLFEGKDVDLIEGTDRKEIF